ncbi:MAG TPA: condensation domain-containing protein, partial [Blastocatellia bacterium]|nr:condensation domain-containing protein [Blastocatellia bacterium]
METLTGQVAGFQLSPQQNRLWRAQEEGGSNAFRTEFSLVIEGPLDKTVLRKSLRGIVERYEIFRTRFPLI